MPLSLAGSYSEKAREKVNIRHDLLLEKQLRDLEKSRQTVERELTFEQKAVRAELTLQRRSDHRFSGSRRGSGLLEVMKDLQVSSSRTADLPPLRTGRRCSLPVSLLPALNSVTDQTDSKRLRSIEEDGERHKVTTRLSLTPPSKPGTCARRRSLQPITSGSLQQDVFKARRGVSAKSKKASTGPSEGDQCALTDKG